jgi:tetratricopeptide (TPR) repeat protein
MAWLDFLVNTIIAAAVVAVVMARQLFNAVARAARRLAGALRTWAEWGRAVWQPFNAVARAVIIAVVVVFVVMVWQPFNGVSRAACRTARRTAEARRRWIEGGRVVWQPFNAVARAARRTTRRTAEAWRRWIVWGRERFYRWAFLTVVMTAIALLLSRIVLPAEVWEDSILRLWWLILPALVLAGLVLSRRTRPEDVASGVVQLPQRLLHLSRLVIAVITAGVLTLLLSVLIQTVARQTIDVRPFDVPKVLADRGFSPTVAARRLRDAIEHIVSESGSSAERPQFAPEGPDIVIHEVWLQPEAIASWLGNRLHLRPRQDITGEITIAKEETDKSQVCLRVRFNGLPFPGSGLRSLDGRANCIDVPRGTASNVWTQMTNEIMGSGAYVPLPYAGDFDLTRLDELFWSPAWGILKATDPVFLVSACAYYEPAVSRQIAHLIIAASPATSRRSSEIAARAHNLLGILYSDENKLEDAKGELELASGADQRFAIAMQNVGDLSLGIGMRSELTRQGEEAVNNGYRNANNSEYKESVIEYGKALQRDRNNASAYLDLGAALYLRHNSGAAEKFGTAIGLIRQRIGADPTNAREYYHLGRALSYLAAIDAETRPRAARDERNEALAALSRAVELKPESINVHYTFVVSLGLLAPGIQADERGLFAREVRTELHKLQASIAALPPTLREGFDKDPDLEAAARVLD